jgi:hypothetical protein
MKHDASKHPYFKLIYAREKNNIAKAVILMGLMPRKTTKKKDIV